MPAKATPAFWRRTPPAVFPPIMGLFGLGLAWRRAGPAFDVPAGWSDALIGAVTLLFLFLAAAYLAKLIYRPGVIIEDLRILPGRAGLAAMTLCTMLMAAGLVPVFPETARTLLFAAIALHGGLAALVVHALLTGPDEQRQVTPVWHLSFVGFIVAPLAAAPLGLVVLAKVTLYGAMIVAAGIYAISLGQLIRRDPPPPLRPLLAIHVAPLSLFGTAAHMLGYGGLALLCAGLATVVLAALLVRARYLTATGFSPLWGAFTFPLAAYAGLMLALGGGTGGGEVFRIVGGVVLVAATLIVPAIAWRVLQLWARGSLAVKTNAALA